MRTLRIKVIYLGKEIENEKLSLSKPVSLNNIFLKIYSMNTQNIETRIEYMIWDLNPCYFPKKLNIGKNFMEGSHALIINPENIDSNVELVIKDYNLINKNKIPLLVGNFEPIDNFKNVKTVKKAFEYLDDIIPTIY